jgi:Lrp/AsnC family transcriptional regulator for asnA, asnC and gidA
MDSVDRQLIGQLLQDGRMGYAELARLVGIDERTARRRVQALTDEGCIWIKAVVAPQLRGIGAMAIACMSVQTDETEYVVRRLQELPEVSYLTLTTGRFNIQAEISAVTDSDLERVLTEHIRPLVGVSLVEVLYYLRLHYQRVPYGDDESGQVVGVRPLDLDETDRQLVAALTRNGRTPFGAVARRIGKSETIVRERYKRLTAVGAVRVVAVSNVLALGFHASCWLAIKVGPGGSMAAVAEALTAIPNITYVAITAGSIDVLAEMICRTHDDLIALVDERIRLMEGVAHVEIWMYLDVFYPPPAVGLFEREITSRAPRTPQIALHARR